MNIVDKKEMTIIEVLEFCIEKGVKNAQKRLDSVTRAKKLSTSQKKTLQGILECYFENVEIVGGGLKSGKIIVSGCHETEKERVTGNATNGYKRTQNENTIKKLIYQKLLEEKKHLDKHRSYNGWATFFGIDELNIDEDKAVKYLEEYYGYKSNEWFKPMEIVNEFQKAHINYRKAVVRSAFDALVKEGKVKLESFYVSGTPEEDGFHRFKFKEITHEEYEEMRALRQQVIEDNGSTLKEYFSFLYKKKTEKMKKVFTAVEDALMKAYGVTRFHESFKVTLCNPQDEESQVYDSITHSFMLHMVERSITYRHNRDSYKASTYFWSRFYILNTFKLIEFMGQDGVIGKVLKAQEEREFNTNLKSYLYDFDTSDYMISQIEAEGFFGDVKIEALERHERRMESLEIGLYDAKQEKIEEMLSQLPLDMLFDPSTDTDQKAEEKENHNMTSNYKKYENAEEMEWLSKFDGYSRKKKVQHHEPTQTPTITPEEMKTNSKMINMSKIGLEDEPIVERVKMPKQRIFCPKRIEFSRMPERESMPSIEFEHVEIPPEVLEEWRLEDEAIFSE